MFFFKNKAFFSICVNKISQSFNQVVCKQLGSSQTKRAFGEASELWEQNFSKKILMGISAA